MARLGKCFVNVATVVMTLVLILPSSSYAATYYVGDQDGWTYDVDFNSWVAGKTFYVGDVLVFIYDNTQHNVFSVDANGYNTCSTNKYYGSYASGNDQITLTAAGDWYFICSYHCNYASQKVAITAYSS
ncbi:blue copper protein-like [Syzygium oleosum]|uniref:blue copper protein-like n=1 Tax=Syzygium oleosum TaxID=219896 RepID=UPI0024B95E62|nr:blue copper protein-like [Syzygium oleosum]